MPLFQKAQNIDVCYLFYYSRGEMLVKVIVLRLSPLCSTTKILSPITVITRGLYVNRVAVGPSVSKRLSSLVLDGIALTQTLSQTGPVCNLGGPLVLMAPAQRAGANCGCRAFAQFCIVWIGRPSIQLLMPCSSPE